MGKKLAEAAFAAGCFWGIQQAFDEVKGVVETEVGYTGGSFKNPAYEDVCGNRTGHAEAVLVKYDAQQVSYGDLLNVFWRIHDPTQHMRQGPDVGSQYRSAIFYFNEAQRKTAEKSKLAEQKNYSAPIATEIVAAGTFWPAEEYHQKYYLKHSSYACHTAPS